MRKWSCDQISLSKPRSRRTGITYIWIFLELRTADQSLEPTSASCSACATCAMKRFRRSTNGRSTLHSQFGGYTTHIRWIFRNAAEDLLFFNLCAMHFSAYLRSFGLATSFDLWVSSVYEWGCFYTLSIEKVKGCLRRKYYPHIRPAVSSSLKAPTSS